MWGHDYHFHVRIKCPEGEADCKPQDPVPEGDGCGHELDWWFRDAILFPKPPADTAETKAADDAGRPTGGLPPDCDAALDPSTARLRIVCTALPPTPDPSPPFAALTGGGERQPHHHALTRATRLMS